MQISNQIILPPISFQEYISKITSDIAFAKKLLKNYDKDFLGKKCLDYLSNAESWLSITLDSINHYDKMLKNMEEQMSKTMFKQLTKKGFDMHKAMQDRNFQDWEKELKEDCNSPKREKSDTDIAPPSAKGSDQYMKNDTPFNVKLGDDEIRDKWRGETIGSNSNETLEQPITKHLQGAQELEPNILEQWKKILEARLKNERKR